MVHFVGAGCGAADLITLRGKALLENADLIIYAGSLINTELLSFAKKDCGLYDSAKMTLEEVLSVITRAEGEGKTTVRLHSGDPCLYGATKEQMTQLDALGIKYDVCPGVSSFCGAAASLCEEYTPSGVSQSVIITRMEGKTPVPEKENMRSLASHGATMVIFLSMSLLDKLQKELIAGGYPPETPAAIVYKASWEDEKILRCTVGEIYRTAKDNGITKTALVTVGDFLGDDFIRSQLYHSEFSTEFRKGKKGNE